MPAVGVPASTAARELTAGPSEMGPAPSRLSPDIRTTGALGSPGEGLQWGQFRKTDGELNLRRCCAFHPSRCLLLSFVQILNNLPSNVCDRLGHCWRCHMSSQAGRAEPRPTGEVWTQLTGWHWMRGESCHVIPGMIFRGFMSRTWVASRDRAGTSISQC